MDFQEAQDLWAADRVRYAELGATLPDAVAYIPDGWKQNCELAMDAQPDLFTAPNSGVPAWLTTLVDPAVFRVLFAPLKAAEIIGENRKGTWVDDTAMFQVTEHTGEVSSYGDWANNGSTGVNVNWPQRQAYLFQTIKQYGERELERAGLARINWVSELDAAAANALNRYQNGTYFFGVSGLQNYGLLNDPSLSAALTPAIKVYGGVKWVVSNVVVATANEVFTDIQSLYIQLVRQSAGLIDKETKVTLALSPQSEMALTATNTFNVNVSDLLKKNFPNIKVVTATQYGAQSASNPQGVVAGEFVQMIADEVEGQDTGFASFNEKLRAHKIIPDLSSWKQKMTSGTWGTIIRMPLSISSMVGV